MSVDPWANCEAKPEQRWHDRETRVELADEIEAVLRSSKRIVIISDEGSEWRNANHVVEGWVRLGQNLRLVRATSRQLAVNGPYTVVFREVAS